MIGLIIIIATVLAVPLLVVLLVEWLFGTKGGKMFWFWRKNKTDMTDTEWANRMKHAQKIELDLPPEPRFLFAGPWRKSYECGCCGSFYRSETDLCELCGCLNSMVAVIVRDETWEIGAARGYKTVKWTPEHCEARRHAKLEREG